MDIQEIKKILSANQSWAKKAYGQHFLVDESVLDTIIETAELKPTDRVVEIGPGLGVLTERLIEKAGEVVAIEADGFLVKYLKNKYSSFCHSREGGNLYNSGPLDSCLRRNDKKKEGNDKNNKGVPPLGDSVGMTKKNDSVGMTKEETDYGLRTTNLKLIEGDALQVIDSLGFKEEELKQGYKVVANIPYSITSKLIRLFLENDYPPESLTLLVQKEVAERIVAQAGEMSMLALSVQYYGEAKIIKIVPAPAFWPAPKVESAVISISNIKNKISKIESQNLFRLARIGFSSRRKTLANNLSAGWQLERDKVIAIIKSVGLKETVRAQELSVEDWERLVSKLSKLVG